MKRKVLSVMLAGALALTSLTACGGGAAQEAPAAEEAAEEAPAEEAAEEAPAEEAAEEEGVSMSTSDDPNTITVAAWDPGFNIPALEAAAAAYKEKNPDATIEIQEVSQSSDVENAITLAGSSGDYSNLPDIVLFQDHFIQRYVTDYPDAWQDLSGADINWDNFGQEKLSYSTINGAHYGVPVDNGTVIFAYRTDILEQCGYTIDDVTGITWDRFDEIGKEVYEKTGKYLLSMDGSGNDLPYMMLQAEGESQFQDGVPVLVGNQKVVDIMNVLAKLQADNVLYLANDWGDYTDQTIQGDMVAGVMNGNWIIPTIKKVEANNGQWEITSMPTLGGEEGYASNGGSSLYITGNCTKTELAQDFLAYTFGGGDGALATYDDALRNGGVITCFLPAGESAVYQEPDDYFNGQAIYAKIVEMGGHVPTVEQNDYHYTCRQYMGNALQAVANGSDMETELQNAEDQLKFEMGL